jgi:tripartite-type tricarboxylate transporter receptor subunit TctC
MLNVMAGTQAMHRRTRHLNARLDRRQPADDGNNRRVGERPPKAGSVRPIAVTSLKRSKFAPDLPPIAEVVPNFSLEVWWAVLAPAKTPQAIVDMLNAEIRASGDTPEMRELYARESTEPGQLTAGEFTTFLADEIAKWRRVAKDRNITLD